MNWYQIVRNGGTSVDLFRKGLGTEGAREVARALKESNTTVKELNLAGNIIGNAGAIAITEALKVNIVLQKLYLWSNNIGENGAIAIAAALEKNGSLQQLNLFGNKIGDKGTIAIAAALEKNGSLQELDLGYNNIEDAGAIAIAEALKVNIVLQQLDLRLNIIGDAGAIAIAAAFEKNGSLQQLNLFGNKIGDKGTIAIGAALEKNGSLQQLDLERNNIEDAGAIAIAAALEKNESLQQLDLRRNNIGDKGTIAIAAALEKNGSLQQLNLWDNNIGDKGTIAIAAALEKNGSLQQLNLGYNNIGAAGAIAIAEALKVNIVLQKLDLSSNIIGDKGTIAIAAALEKNGSLQQLNLFGNKIGDKGTIAIAAALEKNGSLQQLNLGYNNIGAAGAIAIAAALEKNGSLQQLDLEDNNIEDAGAIAIATALEKNGSLQQLNLEYYGLSQVTLDRIKMLLSADSREKRAAQLLANSLRQQQEEKDMAGSLNDGQSMIAVTTDWYQMVRDGGTVVNLSCKCLGDDGAREVARALKESNTRVKELNLRHNKIGDKGAIAIAEALEKNGSLQLLNLEDNEIGERGGIAIAAALEKNGSLQTLNLTSNKIFYWGAIAIAAALEKNGSLQKLNLGGNKFADAGAIAIVTALEKNGSLQQLNLEYYGLSQVTRDRIKMLLSEDNRKERAAQLLANALRQQQEEKERQQKEQEEKARLIDKNDIEYRSQQQQKAEAERIAREQKLLDDRRSKEEMAAKARLEKQQLHNEQHPNELTTKGDPNLVNAILMGRRAIQNLLQDASIPPVLLNEIYAEFLSKSFSDQTRLGGGTFGEVYFVKDDAIPCNFAVKRMRLNLLPEERDQVIKTFRTEISVCRVLYALQIICSLMVFQVLQRFRHPNLARMYGYFVPEGQSSNHSHYLVYEYCSKGSLDSLMASKQGRQALTFERRVGIAMDIAKALHFLHQGHHPDKTPVDREVEYAMCHRDLHPGNIGITHNFTAKLIDCGLGKLVADDTKLMQSIAKSVQISTGRGGKVGAEGYRCVVYNDDPAYRYGPECDMFSYGCIIVVLLTGSFSKGANSSVVEDNRGELHSDMRSFFQKYIDPGRRNQPRDLMKDIDPFIGDYDEASCQTVCDLALECMDDEIISGVAKRPSALNALHRLEDLMTASLLGLTQDILASSGSLCTSKCLLCMENRVGLSCDIHFQCQKCFLGHPGLKNGIAPMVCMMQGCDHEYKESDIQAVLPEGVFDQYKQHVATTKTYFEMAMPPDVLKYFNQMLKRVEKNIVQDISAQNHAIEARLGVIQSGIQRLDCKLDRCIAGLSFLVRGQTIPCPKMIWIGAIGVHQSERTGVKGWFKNLVEKDVEIYFLSEDDYSLGHREPMVMHMKRPWLRTLLPVIKISLLAVKLAGVATALPLPIPDIGVNDYLDSISELCIGVADNDCVEAMLSDLEACYTSAVEKGVISVSDANVEQIQEFVGESYKAFADRAMVEKHRKKWEPFMGPAIVHDASGDRVKWVRKARICRGIDHEIVDV